MNDQIGKRRTNPKGGRCGLKHQTVTTPDGLIVHMPKSFIGQANGFTLYLWTSA